jgi:MFS_1 like family
MNRFTNIVTKYLIVPKLLYVTLSLVFYSLHQFRTPFVTHQYGITKGDFGVKFSFVQLIAFLVNLWIAAVNDETGKQKFVISGIVIASAAIFQMFFMISSPLLFWGLFTVYFGILSASIPLLDKVVIDYLNSIPGAGPSSYGSQRVFATIGYLLANFMIEKTIDVSSDEKDFSGLQYYNIVVALISALCIFLFVKNLAPQRTTRNYLQSMKQLARNKEYLYFIMIITLTGVSRAAMTVYLSSYYTDVLKFDKLGPSFNVISPLRPIVNFLFENKQSTTTLFGCALEIVVFFNSSIIIQKLGLFWPILLAQFFQLLRFTSYYFLDYKNKNSFIYCCGIELFKGANYSLIHSSAVLLATKLCPPHLRTTSQIIYNGCFVAVGTILSGAIFNKVFQPSTKLTRIESSGEFKKVFAINIFISLAIIGLFVFKYGVLENLLLNKQNADKKIADIEMQSLEEEKIGLEKEEKLSEQNKQVSV